MNVPNTSKPALPDVGAAFSCSGIAAGTDPSHHTILTNRFTRFRDMISDAYSRYWYSNNGKRISLWLYLLMVVTFNSLIAVGLTLVVWMFTIQPIGPAFADAFLFSQCIGGSIRLLFDFSRRIDLGLRIESGPFLLKLLYWAGIPIGGVYIGTALALVIKLGPNGLHYLSFGSPGLRGSIILSLTITAIMYRAVIQRIRRADYEAELGRERLRASAAEQAASVAQLKMLQAQIEPHFLFNTLANVLGLIDEQPNEARRMLEYFIHYLRGSLDVTRQETTSLGSEIDLVASYLSILQIRMGERLQFFINLPEHLRQVQLAPMLLQPIVENAIQHGLDPMIDGGRVDISVHAVQELHAAENNVVAQSVEIRIADSGHGFGAETSGGIGLMNVRQRLNLIYGVAGRLTVQDNLPQGAIVTLTIPLSGQSADLIRATQPLMTIH